MSTQKYQRIYDYIHEYQNLVYDFYSKDIVAFLTTYYHINSQETIWDNENVMGGSYDKIASIIQIILPPPTITAHIDVSSSILTPPPAIREILRSYSLQHMFGVSSYLQIL